MSALTDWKHCYLLSPQVVDAYCGIGGVVGKVAGNDGGGFERIRRVLIELECYGAFYAGYRCRCLLRSFVHSVDLALKCVDFCQHQRDKPHVIDTEVTIFAFPYQFGEYFLYVLGKKSESNIGNCFCLGQDVISDSLILIFIAERYGIEQRQVGDSVGVQIGDVGFKTTVGRNEYTGCFHVAIEFKGSGKATEYLVVANNSFHAVISVQP